MPALTHGAKHQKPDTIMVASFTDTPLRTERAEWPREEEEDTLLTTAQKGRRVKNEAGQQ